MLDEQHAEAARMQWVETSADGRYKKSRCGVIFDTKTDLEWYVGSELDTTWDEAKKWADRLTVGGGGWRMPTIDELQGLYQEGKGPRNMDPLFDTPGYWMWIWSCEEVRSSPGRYYVYFYGGYKDCFSRHSSHNIQGFYVRNVRNIKDWSTRYSATPPGKDFLCGTC